ncbi:HDOD domain-containing protein [Propionivibrio sp.]|uniref:EAL and HDOD domain-containing protein n=1 Tax=Propionivibrio sp. TaxID=2212460 RepID=UPI0026226C92|nr:HDOD domain-containing protein [Propionivibrio sp.]
MSDSAINEALLSRQPVVDLQHELFGYELSLQSPAEASRPATYDRSRAATLVCAVYAELGIRSALGRSKAFLRVDPDFVHDDAVEALPSDAVVLELVLNAAPDERTLERCRALRDRHYALALADYVGLDECSRPLLTMLDIVKIDITRCDDAMLRELAGPLAKLPLKLLAKGVDTQEQMERCQKIGFQLFQGHFFARPEIVSGRRLSASQAALIQLINLAGRDSDTAKIEEAMKHEPALAVNLLRIVNSVGYGLSRPIASLRHAITLLGRRQLQRWLQLLLMAPSGKTPDASRSPLLQLAALRGRMMEMLIAYDRPADQKLADQAFITGIMSMMPAALGLPMNEIFEQIALEAEIMQALISRAGRLGKTLALIDCFDADDGAGCDALLAQLSDPSLTRSTLNTCLMESLRWVNGNSDEN